MSCIYLGRDGKDGRDGRDRVAKPQTSSNGRRLVPKLNGGDIQWKTGSQSNRLYDLVDFFRVYNLNGSTCHSRRRLQSERDVYCYIHVAKRHRLISQRQAQRFQDGHFQFESVSKWFRRKE